MFTQGTHALQLFDTPASLAESVTGFVQDGLRANDVVLIVASSSHWDAIRSRLVASGVDVSAARAAGALVTRDAHILLASLMRDDRFDWNAVEATIGGLVRQLRTGGRHLRVYGEMVDILARAGEFDAARGLEECWNRLAEVELISLLCGYMAEHFGNPRDAQALRAICNLHAHAHAAPTDVLGSFLLKSRAAC